MSLPPELRALCHQLSSTSNSQLLQLTPVLLRNVLRCPGPLSASVGNGAKPDASESSVLVHKLKTQVSTLLYGKAAEGRLAAVVLIKGIVDVGGWEVLRGAESWVRGLLAILGKPDCAATKKLCILTLTSIYLMTHEYQSLVREITTPTLPTFVSSCLNLISTKSSGKVLDVSPSLTETVLESFSALIPRHPTIFRPFTHQINQVTRVYVASTSSDAHFVPVSLKCSARRLAVLLHQTAAKNTSGEDWGKHVRLLVNDIHVNTDQVFRAVVEDWESTSGYISQPVDVNEVVHGGAKSDDDLPAWEGIDAGVERLTCLLGYLEEHFIYQTATAVTVPLGIIVDLLTRLMSVAPPKATKGPSDYGSLRLHPAVDRDEREGLWSGLPQVHVAAMKVYEVLVDRLQQGFTSLAQNCIDQMTWSFSFGQQDHSFRAQTYSLLAKVLPLCGSSLPKPVIDRMTPIMLGCCGEFSIQDEAAQPAGGKSSTNSNAGNADTFLQDKNTRVIIQKKSDDKVRDSAAKLLPLLLLDLPQKYLDGYLRSEIDRTAILMHQKEVMISSVINPYIGKNGKSLPSILPHLAREFSHDNAVESFLRPRMPVIRHTVYHTQELLEEQEDMDEDEIMEDLVLDTDVSEAKEHFGNDVESQVINHDGATTGSVEEPAPINHWGEGKSIRSNVSKTSKGIDPAISTQSPPYVQSKSQIIQSESQSKSAATALEQSKSKTETPLNDLDGDSDSDGSVHLVMDLSDSEDESTA